MLYNLKIEKNRKEKFESLTQKKLNQSIQIIIKFCQNIYKTHTLNIFNF